MYYIYKILHQKDPFLIKMKFTLIFLLLGINISNALNTYSQSTFLSIHLKDKSMKDVFREIEKDTEYISVSSKQ